MTVLFISGKKAINACFSKRIVPLAASRNGVIALISMQIVAWVIIMYMLNDKIRTKRMIVLEEKGKNVNVQRYNVFNDISEPIDFYNLNDGGRNNTSFKHEKEIHLWPVLRQIKPTIIQDDDFGRESLLHEKFFQISRQSKEISCSKLFEGEKREHERAQKIIKSIRKAPDIISPEEYISITSNCSKFTYDRGYIMQPLTKEEDEFPIAFSIIMYKDVWQFERLLRAIYRPQNSICIHVDCKTIDVIFKAVSAISDCFGNVFIASKRVNVTWGTFTALEPDIVCMKDLWNRSKSWKYLINLTGQEFPLRTNNELVKILKLYNGSNALDSTYRRIMRGRTASSGPPPYGLKIIKGAVHIAASRGFVGFIVNDQRAEAVLNWSRHIKIPDEYFFQILNFNPSLNAPGSYKGIPETRSANRLKLWGKGWSCGGKSVRDICILGTRHLPMLAQSNYLFANKFLLSYQRLALDCMEELLFNRTLDQYLGKVVFD